MDILAPSVHVEGFLQQRSAGPVKSLKKKWFVLRDQEFKMYNNPNDAISRATCQDMIYIHDIQGVRKLASGSSNKCGIEIVSRFRKYTLVAANPIDQDKWIKAFHDAMRNIRMRSLSSPMPYNVEKEEQSHHLRKNKPSTPPEVRKYRISAAECMSTSSQKKRLFSESWFGKKLSRKSASVDDELLDPDRNSRRPLSDRSVDSGDRDHIYDAVTEFKTITEGTSDNNKMGLDQEQNDTGDEDVFEKEYGAKQQEQIQQLELPGDELYDSVAREEENVVKVIVEETAQEQPDEEVKTNMMSPQEVETAEIVASHKAETTEIAPLNKIDTVECSSMHKVEAVVEMDENTVQAFEDPTYIEELHEDGGVEELRKMIRDSGLDFDDTEDDYERIEGIGDDEDTPAMAKLREMLGTM